MIEKPDAETLRKLREFSRQQVREFMAKQREIKELQAHLSGDVNQVIDRLVSLLSTLSAEDRKRAVDKLSLEVSLIPNNSVPVARNENFVYLNGDVAVRESSVCHADV